MASTTSAKRSRNTRPTNHQGPAGAWSPAAPDRLALAYASDGPGWQLWQKHLTSRKWRPLARLVGDSESSLLWALQSQADAEVLTPLTQLLRNAASDKSSAAVLDQAALEWLSRADATKSQGAGSQVIGDDTHGEFALECLAWAGALPEIAARLDEGLWWQILNRLLAIANQPVAASPVSLQVLTAQLLNGELPLTLSHAFPELAASQPLAMLGRNTLEQATVELLGPSGHLQGRHLEILRPLLASWTRSRLLSNAIGVPELGESQEATIADCYAGLVAYALRLSRLDGRQNLSLVDSPRWSRRLLKVASNLAGDRKTRRLAEFVDGGGKHAEQLGTLPKPALECEQAGIAVLRTDWNRRSAQLVVNYGAGPLHTELNVGKQCLWSGLSDVQLRFDGQSLEAIDAWEQVCWESDVDVDYLELERTFSNGVSLQRHILLARRDRFLIVADAVLGSRTGKFEYRASLPLGDWSNFASEAETREGTLNSADGPVARVLPLALSEWRTGPTCGTLTSEGNQLTLTQAGTGHNLFAPLFIDFEKSRLGKELTWRQLTVGENRQAVPRDEAVGFRVQVGKLQWLLYRSLGETGTRTVLGRNLFNEFLVGRFQADGTVVSLLEIEP